MTISPEQLAEHIAEMNIVATNAMQNIAKAARRAEDSYGNRGAEEEAIDDWGILGQRGRGGLGDAEPEGIPMHKPVPSSGAQRLSAESDVMEGDGSTRASAALSRELSMARAALKSTRRALEQILEEEPEQDIETNQESWPHERASHDDLLSGHAMQRASVSDLLGVIGGRGAKALPTERLAKSAMALCKAASARVDAACNEDSLNLNEQLACSTMLGYLTSAAQGSTVAGQAFADAFSNADAHIRALFDV